MALPGLIVKKVGMTRMVDEDGRLIPVTLVQADKQKVTKILTEERDGYHAIQVGYHEKKEKQLKKPDVHRLRKVKVDDNFSSFKEFRYETPVEELELGSVLSVSNFEGVPAVDVVGVTKGRGFQGTTRRYNTSIGRRTHGSRYHRRGGSLGQCTTPGRVFKNKIMPGHMGVAVRTVQNLKVVDVDEESNVIAIYGSVPGHRDGYLIIKPSVKIKKEKA